MHRKGCRRTVYEERKARNSIRNEAEEEELTEGLFGNPTRCPHVLSRFTNRSLTTDWLIQGRFHPENEVESAAVKDSDRFGDKFEAEEASPPVVEEEESLVIKDDDDDTIID